MACSIFYGLTVAALITCVELLRVAQRLNTLNTTRRDVGDSKSGLEPFHTRIITRERTQLGPLRAGNTTVNALLLDHYTPHSPEGFSMPGLEADSLEMNDGSYVIDHVINRIRPCPSPRLSALKETLDTRIMSLVLSWPHCLQKRPPIVPRSALQSQQMKLGQKELIYRFQSQMAKLGPTLRSSASVDFHVFDSLRNY